MVRNPSCRKEQSNKHLSLELDASDDYITSKLLPQLSLKKSLKRDDAALVILRSLL
jgi:hypothetical protein